MSEANPLNLATVWQWNENIGVMKHAVPLFKWSEDVTKRKLQGAILARTLKALQEQKGVLQEKVKNADHNVSFLGVFRLQDESLSLLFSWDYDHRARRSGGHSDSHEDHETAWGSMPITAEEEAFVDIWYMFATNIILAEALTREAWVNSRNSMESSIKQKKLDGASVRERRQKCLKKAMLDDESIRTKRRKALLVAGHSQEEVGKYLKERS